jgi:hypothetical protein
VQDPRPVAGDGRGRGLHGNPTLPTWAARARQGGWAGVRDDAAAISSSSAHTRAREGGMGTRGKWDRVWEAEPSLPTKILL